MARARRPCRTSCAPRARSTPSGSRALPTGDRGGRARWAAPQDIEWTLRGGELFLLQARPITAKPAPLGQQRIVWDNSNIQESFNGVTSPLTFSLAARAYERVWANLHRRLGASDETLERYEPVLRNMIGHVDGHVYYNINNLYRVMLLFPRFDRGKERLDAAIGIEHPVDFIEDQQLSRREKLRRLPGLARAGFRLAWEFRRRERSIERFLADFSAQTSEIDHEALARADIDESSARGDEPRRRPVGQPQDPHDRPHGPRLGAPAPECGRPADRARQPALAPPRQRARCRGLQSEKDLR